MDVVGSKRLTHAGAKKMMATAIAKAEQAGIAISAAIGVAHALGLALAAGPERWTAMEGGYPIIFEGECIGGIGVSGGDWATDEKIAQARVESIGASWK